MINSFMGIQNTVDAVEWGGDYRMPLFVENIQMVFGDLPTASLFLGFKGDRMILNLQSVV